MKNVIIIVLVALVSLAGGYFLNQWYNQGGTITLKQTQAAPAPSTSGQQTLMRRPDFALEDVHGKIHHMKEWDGKVVMLNFWATWCPPCQREMPAFVQLYENYKDQGFTIIGVAVDEKQPVIDFIDPLGVDYPILIGNKDGISLSQSLGNRMGVLPYTVFIDRQGRVVSQRPAEISYQQAEALIKPLL